MKILTLDFETFDPLLLTYGIGSCFKYHYPEVEFEVLGCGLITHEGEEIYLTFTSEHSILSLRDLISRHDAILCHNSLYDISILKYLFRDEIVWQDKLLIDTVLLAKHDDQSRFGYHLDGLCQDYKCTEKKESDILHDYAWLSGIYKTEHKKETGRDCHTRPSKAILNKFCMSDMRRFPVEVVKEYCLQDVRATKALYEALQPKLTYLDPELDSDILKVCIDCKFNGVRIDLKKADELVIKFKTTAYDSAKIVWDLLGRPDNFNINSNLQLGNILYKFGYKLPLTDKGNPSLRSEWLKEQDEEIYTHIRRYRKALKVNEYINKLIKYQEVIPEKYRQNGIGWLYPSLKPYGATSTGRFTSGGGTGCQELSIHQIPRRDEEFGAPVRELFLPHEGEQLVCCDFSSQESRLQVHYAARMGLTGAKEIAKKYKDDPTTDYHQLVADICNISRDNAKTINLGLSYGMGPKKLIVSLKTDYRKGDAIIKQYHRLLPFLRQLQLITEKSITKNGYVKLLDGSRLRLGEHEYPSKALNKLTQGSAAAQCRLAMIRARKVGLKVLFSVHDEIIISVVESTTVNDYKLLKWCMEYSTEDLIELELPMYVEGGIGSSWGDAK